MVKTLVKTVVVPASEWFEAVGGEDSPLPITRNSATHGPTAPDVRVEAMVTFLNQRSKLTEPDPYRPVAVTFRCLISFTADTNPSSKETLEAKAWAKQELVTKKPCVPKTRSPTVWHTNTSQVLALQAQATKPLPQPGATTAEDWYHTRPRPRTQRHCCEELAHIQTLERGRALRTYAVDPGLLNVPGTALCTPLPEAGGARVLWA
ncbi:hypothetical protein H920_20192 [Fukomys damarensis]|uniref:Uncharacterized protein n=1 Tax=Fukomys damarensis TaxID=885580 RepID=A0A091CIW9_FUKDA|nr:hypothetical protein H920_20192 [Fukomys damarensis]